MKVTGIELCSSEVEVARFELKDISSVRPYLVKSIVGLDADEIIPKFYGFGTSGLSKLYDFSMPSREIVILLMLNPNVELGATISELRDDLYRAISLSRSGTLQLKFYNGLEQIAQISGHVTKLESPLFTKNAEVQLTLNCIDPMFRSPSSIVTDVSESTTALDPFSITDSISTAAHGFDMELIFTHDATDLLIQDYTDASVGPDWQFQVKAGTILGSPNFKNNDRIHITSEASNKTVWVARAQNKVFIADMVMPGSVWPLMFPGMNRYRITAPGGSIVLDYVEHLPAFWGV